MTTGRSVLVPVLALLALVPATTQGAEPDLARLRRELTSQLPADILQRKIAPEPLAFRGSGTGATVYKQRVHGVAVVATRGSLGAGALLTSDGHVVTAEHVVRGAHRAHSGEWVLVWLRPRPSVRADLDQFLVARILARDVASDLALLRLAEPPPALMAIPLAATPPEIGQKAFVIGHSPRFFWTLTEGIVSQVQPHHSWTGSDGTPRTATAIQTQAAVGPGGSGAPLLDASGALLGVIVASVPEIGGGYLAVDARHVQMLLQRSQRSVR
jgi:serine protease Do